MTDTPHRSERSVIAYLAFMGILLAFGIDSALPAFDDLRVAFDLPDGSNRITLIITLYLLGMSFGQLFYGPLSDRFGRSNALRLGIAVYCLGAIGSIVAPSLWVLFLSRFVWGLGAAAPGVVRAAIARDLYHGDQMARVISIMMGAFMMGPVLAPIVGQGIVAVSSWEWVFGAAVILALIQLAWTQRFGETLAEENRRPLRFAKTVEGFRAVYGTRATLGYTIALTFAFGSFTIFLGSSQPIIDNIFGRGSQFSLWFAVAAIVMALWFFAVNPFIVRYGAQWVAVVAISIVIGLQVVLSVIVLTGDGVPPFGVWFVLIVLTNAFVTLLIPTCMSLALEPMGAMAGTASGVVGFTSNAGGALLAALIDRMITDTVTPMALAYVGYSIVSLGCLVWAHRHATVTQPIVATV